MPQFSIRNVQEEKMDIPGVSETEIQKALHELETINKLLGGYNVTLNGVKGLSENKSRISLIDLGSGGGDVLRKVAQWCRKNNIQSELTGIDMNPLMTEYAAAHSVDFPEIKFKTINIWDKELEYLKPEIMMNSLFCHHFRRDELVRLIKRMHDLSSVGIIINDIHRNWFAYHSIKLLTRIFSSSSLVKYDAPVSVLNSLKRNEWKEVLSLAGISDYTLEWKWAWRWQIIIQK